MGYRSRDEIDRAGWELRTIGDARNWVGFVDKVRMGCNFGLVPPGHKSAWQERKFGRVRKFG